MPYEELKASYRVEPKPKKDQLGAFSTLAASELQPEIVKPPRSRLSSSGSVNSLSANGSPGKTPTSNQQQQSSNSTLQMPACAGEIILKV